MRTLKRKIYSARYYNNKYNSDKIFKCYITTLTCIRRVLNSSPKTRKNRIGKKLAEKIGVSTETTKEQMIQMLLSNSDTLSSIEKTYIAAYGINSEFEIDHIINLRMAGFKPELKDTINHLNNLQIVSKKYNRSTRTRDALREISMSDIANNSIEVIRSFFKTLKQCTT